MSQARFAAENIQETLVTNKAPGTSIPNFADASAEEIALMSDEDVDAALADAGVSQQQFIASAESAFKKVFGPPKDSGGNLA